MAISYKKLWHILIDRNMKKKDLEALVGINHYTMSKLSRDENVIVEILGKYVPLLIVKWMILSIFFRRKTFIK